MISLVIPEGYSDMQCASKGIHWLMSNFNKRPNGPVMLTWFSQIHWALWGFLVQNSIHIWHWQLWNNSKYPIYSDIIQT